MTDKIDYNGISWVNISNPTKSDFDNIIKTYNLNDVEPDDILSKVQRPKYEDYDNFKFMVLHYPIFPNKSYRLVMEELDIIWNDKFLITIHSNRLTKVQNLFNYIKNDESKKQKYLSQGTDFLLYRITYELVMMIFPQMNQISKEIDLLDSSFEKLKPSKIVERMSALRRNIIFLQTSLKPARSIFRNLENIVEAEDGSDKDIHWGDIADFIGKILDMAEDYQELIEGIYSSIDTMLTYRTNSIMKALTMISVIMLPLTLITGFFGMNIELPFADLKTASIYISGFMGIITVAMLLYFKLRKF